ncbi:MAG: hypothetical protein HYY08_03600 [Firmicutes bacterium]|nr:hypothetical protein [Bacillota bacterium]
MSGTHTWIGSRGGPISRYYAGARGEIFLYVPEGFEVIEAKTGSGSELEPAEIGAPAPNVVSLKLEFPGPELRWEARFRSLKARPRPAVTC